MEEYPRREPSDVARALEMAARAMQRIETHEQVCAIRQGQIIDNFKGLKRVVLSFAGAVVAGMAYIIGFLLTHGGIPQVH